MPPHRPGDTDSEKSHPSRSSGCSWGMVPHYEGVIGSTSTVARDESGDDPIMLDRALARAFAQTASTFSETDPLVELHSIDDNTDSHAAFDAASTVSSWQEEAHWMSFQSAVSFITSTHRSTRKKSRKLAALSIQEEENESRETASSLDELALETTTELTREGGEVSPARSALSMDELSAAAAELAEARTRVALAEAERDEMEISLLWNATT